MARRRPAKKSINNFLESLGNNNLARYNYAVDIVNIAVSSGEWVDMPPSVDVRYLEISEIYQGACLFFEDEVMGFLALPFVGQGTLDAYGVPTQRLAYGVNGYQAIRDNTNSVIIWNNYTRTPEFPWIKYCSDRLYDLDGTIDINARAQKTPVLIKCKESQRLTLKNAYKNFAGNEPVIYGDEDFPTDSLGVFNTNAPYVADKIYQLSRNIWNDAIAHYGVFNNPSDKKERQTNVEIVHNSGKTYALGESRALCRQQACEEINSMFGLNISYISNRPKSHLMDSAEGGANIDE